MGGDIKIDIQIASPGMDLEAIFSKILEIEGRACKLVVFSSVCVKSEAADSFVEDGKYNASF